MTGTESGQSLWQSPAFEEINMSAEIGAYQGDDGDRGDPPLAGPSAVEAKRAGAEGRSRDVSSAR